MHRELITGDCLEVMRGMPERSVRLTLTSPPYEDARTYGLGFKLRGMAWVDWMIPMVLEMARVTDGLVLINAAGKVRQFSYSPVIEWLVADLTRNCGLICGPAPYVFHRIGIAGSGSKHYQRRDWEPVYAFALPDRLPLKWADNTAYGHKPKCPPGGDLSYRTADGTRINDPWRKRGRGNGIGGYSGKNQRKVGSIKRKLLNGAEPKVATAIANGMPNGAKLHTKNNGSEMRVQCYTPPAISNPGNVIKCTVGGSRMGHDLAHENEAPFPLALVERFVCWFCPPEETVLDPFCGSGTVAHAAIKHQRGYIGIDVRAGKGGIDTARRRLASVTLGMFS